MFRPGRRRIVAVHESDGVKVKQVVEGSSTAGDNGVAAVLP